MGSVTQIPQKDIKNLDKVFLIVREDTFTNPTGLEKVKAAVNEAKDYFNELKIGVRFEVSNTTSPTDTNIFFEAGKGSGKYVNGNPGVAYADGVGDNAVITLFKFFYDETLNQRSIRHEMGHVLGLGHEHERIGMSYVDTDNGTTRKGHLIPIKDANGVNLAFDKDSIMDYATTPQSFLSEGDITALRVLHGDSYENLQDPISLVNAPQDQKENNHAKISENLNQEEAKNNSKISANETTLPLPLVYTPTEIATSLEKNVSNTSLHQNEKNPSSTYENQNLTHDKNNFTVNANKIEIQLPLKSEIPKKSTSIDENATDNFSPKNEVSEENKKPTVQLSPHIITKSPDMNNLEKLPLKEEAKKEFIKSYSEIVGRPPCHNNIPSFDTDIERSYSPTELKTLIALLKKDSTSFNFSMKDERNLDTLLTKIELWEELGSNTARNLIDEKNSPEMKDIQERISKLLDNESPELKKMTEDYFLSGSFHPKKYISPSQSIFNVTDEEIINNFDQIKAIAEEYPKHQGEIETLTSNSNAQSDQFAGKDNSSSNPFIKENRKDMSNEIDTKVSTNAPTSAVPEPSKEEGLIGAKESKFSSAELQNLWALQAKESNSELFKDPDSKKLILEIAKNIEEMGQSSYVHSPEFEAQRNSPKIKSIIEIMNKLLENEHDEVKTLATNFAIEKALKDENLITDLENLNDIKEVSKKVYHEYREGKLEGKPQQQTVELLTKGGLELLNLITFLPRLLGRVVLERIAGFDLPFLDGFKSNDYLRNILPNIESTTPSDAADTTKPEDTSAASVIAQTIPADTSVPTPATLEPETPKSDDDAQENQSAPGALNLNVTQGTEPAVTDGSSTSSYGDLTSANQFGFFQPFDSGAQQEDSAGYSFDA